MSTTMEATQALVTSEPVQRRNRWHIWRVFARRSDGTGPHFLPDAQNPNISGGAFTQVVGGVGPTIINISGNMPRDGNTPVTSPALGGTTNLIHGTNGERLQSTHTTIPASQTQPTRCPQDTYQDLLEREGYGFPFWVPSPNKGLQAEYRYEGVSIGDVGVFATNGGFDYLFNICLPANDLRNARRLPHNFQPLDPPLTSLDVMGFDEFSPGNYVASREIRANDGDVPLTLRTSTTFVSHGPEGAILVMPDGASVKVLINPSRFTTYLTAERILSFYQFANDVQNGLGRGIANGQLRIVYGCTKSTAFSVASIPSSAASEQPTSLQFNISNAGGRTTESTSVTRGAPSTYQDQYSWNVSGRARVKVGPGAKDQQGLDPSLVAAGLENQCLFVRALDLHLSQETWDRQQLSISGTVPPEAAHGDKSKEASKKTEPSTGNPSFESPSNSVYEDNDGARSDENCDTEVIQLELCPHPSNILKEYLFKEYPHAQAVIISDRDWCYSEDLKENILSESPTISKKHYNDVAASHNLESGTTTTMRDLVARVSGDGVIFFEPRSLESTVTLSLLWLCIKLKTVETLKTHLFGDTGDNRSSTVAHIVHTVLPDYNRTYWRSIVGRSRRFERSAAFTSELYAHPWTRISLIEVLVAQNTSDYSLSDITHLKNTCLGPTGKPDLIVISILAHRLQQRFRQSGLIEDLHEAIFYYRHIIEEHNTAKESFQQAQKGSDGYLSTSFWIYPTVLLGLSAALHIRLQIQKRRSDYQLLLDCLEKQKQLDVLLPDRDTKSTIESVPQITSKHHLDPNPRSELHSVVAKTSSSPMVNPTALQEYKIGPHSALIPSSPPGFPPPFPKPINPTPVYSKPRKRDLFMHGVDRAASKLGLSSHSYAGPSHLQDVMVKTLPNSMSLMPTISPAYSSYAGLSRSHLQDAMTTSFSSSMSMMPSIPQEYKMGHHPPPPPVLVEDEETETRYKGPPNSRKSGKQSAAQHKKLGGSSKERAIDNKNDKIDDK